MLNLDRSRIGEHTAKLHKVKTARAVLKRFDDSVRRVLHEMPAVTRADVRGQAVVQDGDVLPSGLRGGRGARVLDCDRGLQDVAPQPVSG